MMLLDSNIFIYALQPEYSKLRSWFAANDISASSITLLEVLGYHKLNDMDKKDYKELFACTEIVPVSQTIIETAINLRQQKKMSLGDSIIASTAIVHKKTLVTRNIKDFSWIEKINIYNPMD